MTLHLVGTCTSREKLPRSHHRWRQVACYLRWSDWGHCNCGPDPYPYHTRTQVDERTNYHELDATHHRFHHRGLSVPQSGRPREAVNAATFDVGSNVVLVVTLVVNAFTLVYAKRSSKELSPNGGSSVKDSQVRTEQTVSALASAAGVEHVPPPTPPDGTPVTVAT